MNRSSFILRCVAAACVLAAPASVLAQTPYPSRPIRIIVPFPPGGTNDVLARLLAPKLAESLGQPVLVDNRPGGNTLIGTDAAAKAAPDGYSLLIVSSTHVVLPLLFQTGFDSLKDFTPIATLDSSELMLVVHPSVPANNLQELIALSKAKAGTLNYASAGGGGVQHLAAEQLKLATGLQAAHVSYKGGGPALNDIVAGHVQLYFNAPLGVLPFINSGKLKPIAISGAHRLAALPQVPTFAEAGLPNFDLRFWHGIVGPANMPKPVVDRLAAEIARIVQQPDVREKLVAQGLDPFINSPVEFGALMKSDTERFARIVKAANVKVD